MNIEEVILLFDEYKKKNRIFTRYHQKVDDFVEEHTFNKILNYTKDQIYGGENSFLKKIGSEDLMGTRVGAIYSNFPKFFRNPNSVDFFKEFVKNLNLVDKNNFSHSFRKKIIVNNYFDILSLLKTALIQILSCYFPEFFLPIYKEEMLRFFVDKMNIDVENLNSHTKNKLRSKNKKDFGERILLYNEILLKKKNEHSIMKNWNNIVYAHFLFMCLPIEAIEFFKNQNIGIQFMGTNEQFVVGLFSKLHTRLGFRYITRLKTSFPDAEVEDDKGNIKSLEFEYNSLSFIRHGHDPKLCDVIVCWIDEIDSVWKQQHNDIQIIALKDLINPKSALYKNSLLKNL